MIDEYIHGRKCEEISAKRQEEEEEEIPVSEEMSTGPGLTLQ